MSDFNSSLPIRTEAAGDVVVKVGDATTPAQQLEIDASGRVTTKLTDGTGNAVTSQVNGSARALDVGINVSGVQIDPRSIRALTASDIVTSAQGAPNTIANAWPVKLTDGTNTASFTAAGESKVSVTQPLPTGANTIGTVNAKLQDGAGTAVTSTTINAKQRLDVNAATDGTSGTASPFATTMVGGTDGTNLRALSTDASGKLKVDLFDATGTAFSAGNPLPVAIAASLAGTLVNDYNTVSAVAAAATSNHDYTITTSKTFSGKLFWASASGKLKIEVQTSVDGTTFVSKWVGFNSTANPNIAIALDLLTINDTGVGSKIRISRTNIDKTAMDVYSTISGVEN